MIKLNQNGFTIVELLIASSIFASVLLITTFSIIQVSKMYIKGYVESDTQNVAISLTDKLSRSIQYSGSGGVISDKTNAPVPILYDYNNQDQVFYYYYFCIGSEEYFYLSYQDNIQGTNPYNFFQYSFSPGACDGTLGNTNTANYDGSTIPVINSNDVSDLSNLLSNNIQMANFGSTQNFSHPGLNSISSNPVSNLSPNPVLVLNNSDSLFSISIDLIYGSDSNLTLSPVATDSAKGLVVCKTLDLIQPDCATYNTQVEVAPLVQ
jgi:prepilin-type N-terminal cleavage/methylation domain-containing protein